MTNHTLENKATARREEARVEAISLMREGRRIWREGVSVAAAHGWTDLLPARQRQNEGKPRA